MKKNFMAPEMSISRFDIENIVTASGDQTTTQTAAQIAAAAIESENSAVPVNAIIEY